MASEGKAEVVLPATPVNLLMDDKLEGIPDLSLIGDSESETRVIPKREKAVSNLVYKVSPRMRDLRYDGVSAIVCVENQTYQRQNPISGGSD